MNFMYQQYIYKSKVSLKKLKLKFPKRSAVERLGKIIWKSTIKVFQTVNKYISITDKQMFNNIHHFATITKGFHYLHNNNNK